MKTPEEMIKAGTHLYCPECVAHHYDCQPARLKLYPYEANRPAWPRRIEDFDNNHVNELGEFICNYHGNREFNKDHDCQRNACD